MSQLEISAARQKLLPPHEIAAAVARALAEDIGSGDITAKLIPESKVYSARVISREACVISGMPFVEEVFRQVDPSVKLETLVHDGARVEANAVLFRATGCARSILTAERSSLNFLQLLSGVATATSKYVALLEGTTTRLLDTRKTLPGLRLAQKYAVVCGGGCNHRIGLYDMVLIKENHVGAAGSITAAVSQAKKLTAGTAVKVEVETESIEELIEALDAGADIVMLDEFSHEDMRRAVQLNKERRAAGKHSAEIEASGSVNETTIRGVAETGVDFISVGSLTKHVRAVDLSMRFEAH